MDESNNQEALIPKGFVPLSVILDCYKKSFNEFMNEKCIVYFKEVISKNIKEYSYMLNSRLLDGDGQHNCYIDEIFPSIYICSNQCITIGDQTYFHYGKHEREEINHFKILIDMSCSDVEDSYIECCKDLQERFKSALGGVAKNDDIKMYYSDYQYLVGLEASFIKEIFNISKKYYYFLDKGKKTISSNRGKFSIEYDTNRLFIEGDKSYCLNLTANTQDFGNDELDSILIDISSLSHRLREILYDDGFIIEDDEKVFEVKPTLDDIKDKLDILKAEAEKNTQLIDEHRQKHFEHLKVVINEHNIISMLSNNEIPKFDLGGFDFSSNHLISGMDLSNCKNVRIDPQNTYNKDMSNMNLRGVHLSYMSTNLDGVNLDNSIVDDWEFVALIESTGNYDLLPFEDELGNEVKGVYIVKQKVQKVKQK